MDKKRLCFAMLLLTMICMFSIFSFAATNVYLSKGYKIDLKNGKNGTWTSSNKDIATVSNGVVKGMKKGTATITLNEAGKKYNWTVLVSNVPNSYLTKGDSGQLSSESGTWKSSDTSIVTVSKGKIKGKAKGSAKVTLSTKTKHLAWNVGIETPYISKSSVTLYTGQSIDISLKGTKRVPFTGSEFSVGMPSNIKTVSIVGDRTARITAKKPGAFTFSFRLGSKTYPCKIVIVTKSSQSNASYKKIAQNNYKISVGKINLVFSDAMNAYDIVYFYNLARKIPFKYQSCVNEIRFYKTTAKLGGSLVKFNYSGGKTVVSIATNHIYNNSVNSNAYNFWCEIGHCIASKKLLSDDKLMGKWTGLSYERGAYCTSPVSETYDIRAFGEAFANYQMGMGLAGAKGTENFIKTL